MNPKGAIQLVSLIFSYWWLILIIFGLYFASNFAQDYFNPEYCISDNLESREAIRVHGFSISNEIKNENLICFRSNDPERIQQMIQQINDKRLEKEFELLKEKEANKNQIINTLLEPQYFYPLLAVMFLLGLSYIYNRKN